MVEREGSRSHIRDSRPLVVKSTCAAFHISECAARNSPHFSLSHAGQMSDEEKVENAPILKGYQVLHNFIWTT